MAATLEMIDGYAQAHCTVPRKACPFRRLRLLCTVGEDCAADAHVLGPLHARWSLPPTTTNRLSKDKGQLKPVLRACATTAVAISLVHTKGCYRRADAVRTVFEDGAIRFSSLSSSMSGAAVYTAFAGAINDAFAAFPNAHTYVLCFDDKRYVPARKAATQASRRAAMAARNGGLEWAWDGTSPIVDAASHAPLPPWDRVRMNADSYREALSNVVSAVLQRYRPPAGRRLIVDSHRDVWVLETTLDDEEVLAAYEDAYEKPPIGEADIAAQHYVRRSQQNEYPEGACRISRAPIPFPESHRCFYRECSSDVPMAARVRPDAMATRVVDASARCRPCYEAGDIMLCSTDTDFLPLALVAAATTRADRLVRVHVSLGLVHRNAHNEYCTSKVEDAVAFTEIYDMAHFAQALHRMHGTADMTSIWSFVAFCIACGNDYTRRPAGFSHKTLFAAYELLIREGRRLVSWSRPVPGVRTPVPVLNAESFARFLRIAFTARMPESRRPVSWTDGPPTWSELAARSPMLNMDEIERYYEQVAWSLLYAAAAVDGVVPEPLARFAIASMNV